jgi:chorismate mutase
MGMDITAARKAIDKLDEKIVKLLSRRMKLSLLIAGLKAQAKLPARDAKREAFILARAQQLATKSLPGEAAAKVLKRVLEVSRAATKAALKRGRHEKRA